MSILEFYYDEDLKTLWVQFSSKEDKDNFYREVTMTFEDIIFYSPSIITEKDLHNMDIYFVSEVIEQYFLENELPEQKEL